MSLSRPTPMSFLPSSASTLPFLPTASTPAGTQAILQSHIVRLTEDNEGLKRDKKSFREVGDEARRTVAKLERENEELRRRVVEIGEENLALRKKVEGFEMKENNRVGPTTKNKHSEPPTSSQAVESATLLPPPPSRATYNTLPPRREEGNALGKRKRCEPFGPESKKKVKVEDLQGTAPNSSEMSSNRPVAPTSSSMAVDIHAAEIVSAGLRPTPIFPPIRSVDGAAKEMNTYKSKVASGFEAEAPVL